MASLAQPYKKDRQYALLAIILIPTGDYESRHHSAVQDTELREQIERDVMRTHPDMHFFSGDDAAARQHREVGLCSRSQI